MKNLKCPKCKGRLSFSVLMSSPVQYECRCSACRFELKWYKRKNPKAEITQQELREHGEQQ